MAVTLRNENDTRPRLEYYPVNSPTLRTVVIEECPFIIGRGETAQLQIRLESISREHAELTSTSAGYLLRDLNSTNGTAINGQPISEALLEDGDIVSIAETKLTFINSVSGQIVRMVTQPLGDKRNTGVSADLTNEILASRELAEALLWQAIPLKRTRIVDYLSGSEQSAIVSIDEPLASRMSVVEARDACCTASRIQQLAWQLTAEHAEEATSAESLLMRVELQSSVDNRLRDAWLQSMDCLSGSQSLGILLPWEWAVQSPATLALCAELRALGAELAFDVYSGGATCIGEMELASPDYLVLAPSLVRGISAHPRRMKQLKDMVLISDDANIQLVLPIGLDEEDCQASHELGFDLIVSNTEAPIENPASKAVAAAV